MKIFLLGLTGAGKSTVGKLLANKLSYPFMDLDEVIRYETHYRRRLSIRPGLTGLWQVSGRNSIKKFEDILKLDLRYIDEWSIWLDIKIIFRTVWVTLFRQGAY